MKKLLLPLMLFCSFGTWAQNVNIEVRVIAVEMDGYSDEVNQPDPTWLISGSTNGNNTAARILTPRKYHNAELAQSSGLALWSGMDDQIISHTNTSATNFTLSLDAWEDDCVCWPWPVTCPSDDEYKYETRGCISDDEKHCIQSVTVNFQDSTSCVWNEYQVPYNGCRHRFKVKFRWSYVSAPAISGPATVNYSLCTSNSAPALTATVTNGSYYQWQYSENTDCGTPGLWQDIDAGYGVSGYNTATYTPPKIAGTRLYRLMVSSNCTPDYNSQTVYSNCIRVTFNPMGSPGDLAPRILSGICGQSVAPGSSHTFSTLQPPAQGAVVNLTSPFYQWAATGGTPTSGTGATFNWTAPTALGNYVITLKYKSACGDFDPQIPPVTCQVTVGTPPCTDYLYVSQTGTDAGNYQCSASNPCRTVSYAINNVLGARRYIRVSTGSFNEQSPVNMVTDLTIEGQYVVDANGVWAKTNDPAYTTTLNFSSNGSLELSNALGDGRLCHRVGVKSVNANNWSLIDLYINTEDVPTAQTSTDGRGCSNYGILISNSSGYNIVRCNITSKKASAGRAGFTGAAGHVGKQGFPGGTGGSRNILWGIISSDCNSKSFIPGAPGGGTAGNPGFSNSFSGGNNGGSGGDGGSTCGNSCGNSGYPGCAGQGASGSGCPGGPASNPGFGGNGGAGAGNGGDCDRGNGWSGGPGGGYDPNNANVSNLTGTGVHGGTASPSHSYGTYFIPSGQGLQGGMGKAGGGGGGGGASRGESSCSVCWCLSNSGNSGAGGSQGGGGGQGGGSGMGGGASFPVYRTGSSGTFNNAYLNIIPNAAGALGQGGAGGAGGTGGGGGASQPGQGACSGDRGTSGAGGAGGSGAKGGTGQAGAAGVSEKMLDNGTLNSNPSGTIGAPFNPGANTLTLYSQNQDYCINSEIQLSTTSGNNWTFESGLNIVIDKRDAPAGSPSQSCQLSSCNTSGNPISVYTATGNTAYDVTVGSTLYKDALKISSKARTLPSIVISPADTICYQDTIRLSASGSWGTVKEHDWDIYPGDVVSPPVFSSSLAAPTTPPLTCPSGYPCTYTIRYRQREECCGWSKPVFQKVTIWEEFDLGAIQNAGKTICYNTQADIAGGIGFTTLPKGSKDFTYTWYWKYGTECPVSGSISGWTAIGTDSPTLTEAEIDNQFAALDTPVSFACWVAPTPNQEPVCGVADWAENCFTVRSLPPFDNGAVQLTDSIKICGGGQQDPILLSPPPSGAGSFTYQWYINTGDNSNPQASWPMNDPGCPVGTNPNLNGWVPITGATGVSYNPAPINIHVDSGYSTPFDLFIGYAVFVTADQCGSAQWADSCRVIREMDGVFRTNNILSNYGSTDYSTNIAKATVCYGFNDNCGGNCLKFNVSPTSGVTYRVKWQRSYDMNQWETLHVDTPRTGETEYEITTGFTQDTYFRALILPTTSCAGNEQPTYNIYLVDVLDPFDAGEITGDDSVNTECYLFDPPVLTANPTGLFPDGHLGIHDLQFTDYQWEMSTDKGASWDTVSPYAEKATLGTPTVSGGAITTIPVINGGNHFSSAPQVIITDVITSRGGATAVVDSVDHDTGSIVSVTVTNGGTGYTNNAIVTFTDDHTGSGASATVSSVVDSAVTALTLNAGGKWYTVYGTTVNILPHFAQGTPPTRVAVVKAIIDTLHDGAITGFQIIDGGDGYYSNLPPSVEILTDTTIGYGATAHVTITPTPPGSPTGPIASIVIDIDGHGYTTYNTGGATVQISDNTIGTGADVVAVMDGDTVDYIQINDGGSNYLAPKAVISADNHAYNKTYDHDAPLLTDTTWFRYKVRPNGISGLDCYGTSGFADVAMGDTIKYNILPDLNPGAISGYTPHISGKPYCLGYNPPMLSVSPTGAAPTNEYNYEWQTSPNQTDWTAIANSNSAQYDPGALNDTTYYKVLIDPIGSPDCDPKETTVLQIKVGQSPPAYAGDDFPVCGTDTAFNGNAPTLGTWTGTWTRDPSLGYGVITNEHSPNASVSDLYNVSPNNLNRFIWTIVTDLCITTADSMVITSYQEPDNANAGADLYVCDANPRNLNATPVQVAGGTGVWSLFSGTATIADPANPQTQISSMASGLNKFQWTTSNGNCVSKIDYVDVFVSIFPVMTWNGRVNTDWNNPDNWGCDSIPGILNEVIIPLVPNTPDVFAGNVGICKKMEVQPFSLLTVSDMAKFGVNKPFVWANAGPDTSVCFNQGPFQIGKQLVSRQDGYAKYKWTSNIPGNHVAFLNRTDTSRVTVTLQDTITVNYLEYVLQSWHPSDSAYNHDFDTMRIVPKYVATITGGPDVNYCVTPVQLGAGSLAGHTYIWSPPNYLSNPNISNPTANPPVDTKYTLTETNADGCTASDTVRVHKQAAPTAVISSSPAAVCAGDDYTLTFTMTGTGPWDVYVQIKQGATPIDTAILMGIKNDGVSNKATINNALSDTTFTVINVYDSTQGCDNPNPSYAGYTITVPAYSPNPSWLLHPNPVCANQTGVTYSLQNTIAGSTFNWTKPADWTLTAGGGASDDFMTVTIGTATGVQVKVTETKSGCISPELQETVTVTPVMTAGSPSSTPTLCINTALTDITHATTGATGIGSASGLPAGVTAAWASNTITISGTPTASGTFNYSIPLTGGCGSVNATGTITVTPNNTAGSPSSTPTLCINTALTDITHATTGATGIGSASGLPAGVSAAWASNTITISGTPTASGTFNYSIPLTGGCGSVNATGTITVTPNNTAGSPSSTPTLCINTALTDITHATTGATGIGSASGLPAGVSVAWASNTITISGTPTASGTFNYSIPLTGGCGSVNATGTITVTPNMTAGAASSTPTLCINTALTSITHATTGATGIGSASGLPAGVSAAWASDIITISGTPTASGTFNYSIPLTGGCSSANATGTITVTPNNTAGGASSTPTLCINTALTDITHATTGATGIGSASGLPAGVSAAWASDIITISGTPTASGTFNYSIPLTGGCGSINATGTITVTPNMTAGAASSTPTLCINTALTNITHPTTGATGIGSASGLPAGVSAAWASNTITISGTPTASGTFNYSIPLTGGCSSANATGTITVTPNNTAGGASSTPTLCVNTALTNITHTTTGATGISNDGVSGANGLPAGVSATWASNTITISGTPTATGTFNYSIALTGGCGSINATGTITVLNSGSQADPPTNLLVEVIKSGSNMNIRLTVTPSSPNAGVWTWYRDAGASATGTACNASPTEIASGVSSITVTSSSGTTGMYSVRAVASGCYTSSTCLEQFLETTDVGAAYPTTANALVWGQRKNHTHNSSSYTYQAVFPVKINSGTASDVTWTWDAANNFYKSATNPGGTCTGSDYFILIPTKDNAATFQTNYSNCIICSDTLPGFDDGSGEWTGWNRQRYHWDDEANSCCSSGTPLLFNASKIFVSPITSAVTYCKAMDASAGACTASSPASCIELDGPQETFLYKYSGVSPYPSSTTTYNAWENATTNGCASTNTQELINVGQALNGTVNDYIAQQQLAPSATNETYCVAQFGKGWRMPTDVEVGHTNDNTGTGNGDVKAYRTETTYTSSTIIWTSSWFSNSAYNANSSRRWNVRIDNATFPSAQYGNWQINTASEISSTRVLRCVFDGGYK